MVGMKNKTILAILIIFGIFLFGFISASTCDYNVGVRYSYENSYGTGIAINNSETYNWVTETPAILKKGIHKIRYYVDNNIVNITNNASITIKLDGEKIISYYQNIDHFHYKTLSLDTSDLECNSLHKISVEVQSESNGICTLDNSSDNYAERNIYIECENFTQPTCGNGVCSNNENCSICSADCGVCPNPPTNNTNQTESERIINVSHKNSFVQFCNTNWVCSGWSECSNGVIIRKCVDNNHCDTEYNKPYEKTGCDEKILSNGYVEQESVNVFWILLVIVLFVLLLIVILYLLK